MDEDERHAAEMLASTKDYYTRHPVAATTEQVEPDPDERVGLLANEQDVRLLREIAKWRRTAGITYWRSNGNLGRFTQWSEISPDGRQVSIDFERGDEGWCATMTIGRRRELGGIKVGDGWTVQVAVDALVAFGYLPQRFSSAYLAGWNALLNFMADSVGEKGMGDPGDLAPAVEPAW